MGNEGGFSFIKGGGRREFFFRLFKILIKFLDSLMKEEQFWSLAFFGQVKLTIENFRSKIGNSGARGRKMARAERKMGKLLSRARRARFSYFFSQLENFFLLSYPYQSYRRQIFKSLNCLIIIFEKDIKIRVSRFFVQETPQLQP